MGRRSAVNKRMAEVRALPDDLLGGTLQMRRAGERYIPREEAESLKYYRARLQRAFLRPLYEDTLDKLSARPFAARKVKVEVQDGETLPPHIASIERDVDNEGTDLTQFAQQLLRHGIHEGAVGLLVDFPSVESGFSHEKELSGELHAYFAPVCMWAILGYTSRKATNGRRVLSSLRVVEHDPMHGTDDDAKSVPAVRVHREGELGADLVRGKATWEVWTQTDARQDVWTRTSGGTYSVSEIPFRIAYLNKVGFMEAKPCLLGLAWLNGEHWVSGCTQSSGEHYSRVPVFYESGCDQNKADEPLVVASNRAIRNPRAEGKLTVVETTGAALGMGRKTLDAIEATAEAVGLQPLREGTANVTATGHLLNESRSSCALQAWISSLEKLLVESYRLATEIVSATGNVKVALPPGFNVDIFSDFAMSARAGAEIDQLLKMHQAGTISLKTFLREVKRRSVLPEELDVEAEALAIAEEGPRLGLIGFGGGPEGSSDAA